MKTSIILPLIAACLALGPCSFSFAAGEVFAPMKVEEAKGQVLGWAASQTGVSEEQQRELAALWAAGPVSEEADQLLQLVMRSFAAVDADVAKLLVACNSSLPGLLPPDGAFCLWERLRRDHPAPFSAYVEEPRFALVSCSPERFLRLHEGHVETRPIKGTRRRTTGARG